MFYEFKKQLFIEYCGSFFNKKDKKCVFIHDN